MFSFLVIVSRRVERDYNLQSIVSLCSLIDVGHSVNRDS